MDSLAVLVITLILGFYLTRPPYGIQDIFRYKRRQAEFAKRLGEELATCYTLEQWEEKAKALEVEAREHHLMFYAAFDEHRGRYRDLLLYTVLSVRDWPGIRKACILAHAIEKTPGLRRAAEERLQMVAYQVLERPGPTFHLQNVRNEVASYDSLRALTKKLDSQLEIELFCQRYRTSLN